MDFRNVDSFAISQRELWKFLFDHRSIFQCVPRGQSLVEIIANTEYQLKFAAKIGSVELPFDLTIVISAIEPPRQARLRVRGKAGKTFVGASCYLFLTDSGVDRTRMEWRISAAIFGLENQFEKLMIKRAFDQGSSRFIDCLKSRSTQKTIVTPVSAPAESPTQGPTSLAIMPFSDLTPERNQEYLCRGIADQLMAVTSNTKGWRVVAWSSSREAPRAVEDVCSVGRSLNVQSVLMGRLEKTGDALRITTQLVAVDDGLVTWSQHYDLEGWSIPGLSEEISSSIKAQLNVANGTPLVQASPKQETGISNAYHYYLKGRHLWSQRKPTDLLNSIELFQLSINQDPTFALALAGKADAYNLLGYYGVLAPQQVFPKAKAAAQRALEINDSLAEAHCALAFANLLFDWDWQAAARGFERTFELKSSYATARHWYAEYLAFTGRVYEAIEEAERALHLDPLSLIINTLIGWTYYYARMYDLAIERLEATLELDPSFVPAMLWLGLARQQKGDLREAHKTFSTALSHAGKSPMLSALLGNLFATMGRDDEVKKMIAELEATRESSYVPPYFMAAIYAGGGQDEGVFDWLEKAVSVRDSWLVFLNVDPAWDDLRSNPKFSGILEQVGLKA